MSESRTFNRRNFLKTTALGGGGFVLAFSLPVSCIGKTKTANEPEDLKYYSPNAYVKIGNDESVSIVANKAEMGQGIYTTLCQLLADEMEVDWDNVRVEHAPLDPAFNHLAFGMQLTGGSTSSHTEWGRMRQIGAAVKHIFVQAAANEWNIDPSACSVTKGVVSANGKELTYGQLADKATLIELPKLENVKLKDKKDFQFIGKPMHRLDTPIKTNGKAIFGMDVNIPDMKVALVAHSPVMKGKVTSFNADKAKQMPGVSDVVQISSGIAVVADGFWNAKKAREALEITWDEGGNANLNTETQFKTYEKQLQKDGLLAEEEGDINKAFANSKKIVEARYQLPYLAHTPMEPLNCTANVQDDSCDLYIGTQSQTLEASAVSQALGIPMENIKVHLQYLGGGFGRRATFDSHMSVEAAEISQKVKKPVKLIWTREEDVQGGYYRSSALTDVKGSIDDSGNISALKANIVSESFVIGTPFAQNIVNVHGADGLGVEGLAESPYHIPNRDIRWVDGKTNIDTLWLRSVGHSRNAFIMEAFIDELAEAAGNDPYQFRKEHLKNDQRSLDALNLAVSKSPWGKSLPEGHALGLAVHTSFGSAVAQVVEVSIKNNWPKIHNVWAAVDCGPYINPEQVRAQIESGIIFGLTATLYGEISFKNGRVQQSNWHDYKMLRMHEAPHIEVHIVESDKKMGGVGETSVPPIAPAVVNALYKLTGKRIHRLPLNKEDFA